MTKKELTTPAKEENKLVIINGIDIDELVADEGAGSQNVNSTDIATPLLNLLQANSPQCKKSDPKYVQGASEGCIYNNVTGEVYDGGTGLDVVPCYFDKVYIEWKPNRAGFVAIHDCNSAIKDQITMTEVPQADGSKKMLPLLPNGNILQETNQHYVLLLKEDGSFEPVVIPMTNTNLNSSRKWNSLIKKIMLTDKNGRVFNPASFYCHYKLTTKARQKDANSWFVYNVENLGPVPSKVIYDAAKTLEKAVSSGAVKVKLEQTEEVTTVSEDDAI